MSEKSSKREITPERDKFIRDVKKKLYAAYEKSGLNISALLDHLERTYGFGLNKGTLTKLLDEDDTTSMDYACLIAVSHFFGFDFNKLLTPEYNSDKPMIYRALAGEQQPQEVEEVEPAGNLKYDPSQKFIDSLNGTQGQFLILNDEGYEGQFTGYYMPDSHGATTPKKFTLTMRMQDDGTLDAELVRKTRYKNPRTNRMEENIDVYRGVPVYVKAYRSILILLTSVKNSGECWLLAFAYEKYPTKVGLIYRHGLMITGESISGAALSAESFLLFNTPITGEKKKYLHGLLKAPNRIFTVSVEEAHKMAESNPDVAAFLEQYEKMLNLGRTEMYFINEDNILTDKTTGMDKYDRAKALLMLKTISTVAGVYHFRAKYRYTGFAVKDLAEAVLDDPDDEDEAE